MVTFITIVKHFMSSESRYCRAVELNRIEMHVLWSHVLSWRSLANWMMPLALAYAANGISADTGSAIEFKLAA